MFLKDVVADPREWRAPLVSGGGGEKSELGWWSCQLASSPLAGWFPSVIFEETTGTKEAVCRHNLGEELTQFRLPVRCFCNCSDQAVFRPPRSPLAQ